MGIVFSFIVYSVLGWVLDTVYSSFEEKRFYAGNLLRPLPFSPIYGFGALIVLALDRYLLMVPWFGKIMVFGLLLGGFEGVVGMVIRRLLGRSLWRYGTNREPFEGYSDAWHAFAWGVLAVILVYWIHPFLVHVLARNGLFF